MKINVLILFLLYCNSLFAGEFEFKIDADSAFVDSKCAKKVRKKIGRFDKVDGEKCAKYSSGKISYGDQKDWSFHTSGGHPTRRWGTDDAAFLFKNEAPEGRVYALTPVSLKKITERTRNLGRGLTNDKKRIN